MDVYEMRRGHYWSADAELISVPIVSDHGMLMCRSLLRGGELRLMKGRRGEGKGGEARGEEGREQRGAVVRVWVRVRVSVSVRVRLGLG